MELLENGLHTVSITSTCDQLNDLSPAGFTETIGILWLIYANERTVIWMKTHNEPDTQAFTQI